MGQDFIDRLAVSLTLTVGNKAHEIAPGSIRAFELNLHGWGHEGRVEFLVADDKGHGGSRKDALLAGFLKPDLAKVSLEVKAVLRDDSGKPAISPLKVEGLVAEKTLTELPLRPSGGAPITWRRYGVRFVDAAALLWRQHYPCALYTGKSFQQVLEEHKGNHIRLA